MEALMWKWSKKQEEATQRARASVGLPPPERAPADPIEELAAAMSRPAALLPEKAKEKRRPRWGLILANLITAGVGAAAGFVSWQHLSHLGETVGATEQGAFLTPITIDGMILVGTLELRQARKEGRPAKAWAYGAVLIGVVGTIAGNIAASTQETLTARLYFAAPALAFLISVEVLFGKPLSRNLWDLIRGWWAKRPHRAARPVKVQKEQGAPVPESRPAETSAPEDGVLVGTPGEFARRARQGMDTVPARRPAKAPESHGEPTTPRLVPALPTTPRTPARRKTGPAPAAKKSDRPVGTRQRPERMVEDGTILAGPDLQADARARISQALADGRKRDGLGAWVARQYDPPMSDRWGLDRVAEVPDPEPRPTPVLADATGLVLIDPETPEEHAVPIDGEREALPV
jgi:hypothetical protein